MPRVNVSLPRLTPCETVSSVRMLPEPSISAIAIRIAVVPMSMTATGRTDCITGEDSLVKSVSADGIGRLSLVIGGFGKHVFRPRGGPQRDGVVAEFSRDNVVRLGERRQDPFLRGGGNRFDVQF